MVAIIERGVFSVCGHPPLPSPSLLKLDLAKQRSAGGREALLPILGFVEEDEKNYVIIIFIVALFFLSLLHFSSSCSFIIR